MPVKDGRQRLAQANCVAAIQEQLAAKCLQRDGVRWDEPDESGRGRYREFITTLIDAPPLEPRLRLTNEGLTLRTHETLDLTINELKRLPNVRPEAAESLRNAPIWIVESNNPRVIDGHNDFTKPAFREFLVQLYHDRVMYARDPDALLKPGEHCGPP